MILNKKKKTIKKSEALFKQALREANRDIFWAEIRGFLMFLSYALPFLALLFALAISIYMLYLISN